MCINVLIIGGYGSVGSEISKMLRQVKDVHVIVAGHNKEKAEKFARSINVDWKYIDLHDVTSIKQALKDSDIVVNCFIDVKTNSLDLPSLCIERSIHYIDLAGVPISYNEEFLKLHDKAANSDSTLITALGLNPGISGIVLTNNRNHFDRINSAEIYMTMGANIHALSVLSLRGIAEMINAKPLIWENNQWTKPLKSSTKMHIGDPFNKKIYFGPGMITSDLYEIPKITNTQKINFWSGLESLWLLTRLALGIKMGYTGDVERSEKLLITLKRIGDKEKFSSNINLTIITGGVKNGHSIQRRTSLFATEEYTTAVAPVIACRQLIKGLISKKGAFLPPNIIEHENFVQCLKEYDLNFKDELLNMK